VDPVSRGPFLGRRAGEIPTAQEVAVQYALMIYTDPGYEEALSESDRDATVADYLALLDDPRCIQGAQLGPVETATTVRVHGARTVMSDGPFADTKEVLGGYYVLDAANLDEALEFVQRIPAVRLGGAVEVRPLVEIPMEDGF
jgi:hypothetical protein